MQEKDVEQYLRDQVKSIGGKAYKFVSPGNRGVPDRMVCLPGGRIVFVELKATGKTTSDQQDLQIAKLQELGFHVMCFDNKSIIDDYIEIWKEAGNDRN